MALQELKANNNTGFIEKFLEIVSRYPDIKAIEMPEINVSMTYAELLQVMEKMKGFFSQSGMKNRVVCILLPSCPDFIAAFYALISMESIALPLNPYLTEFELKNIIHEINPGYIITLHHLYMKFSSIFKSVHSIVAIDKPINEKRYESVNYISLPEYTGKSEELSAPHSNSVVTYHPTYKGVGFSLIVPHRYSDYTFCLKGCSNLYYNEPGSPILVSLPLYPIYGTIFSVIFPLSFGATLVIIKKAAKHNMINLFETYKICGATIIPHIFFMLINEAKERGGKGKLKFHPDLKIATGATLLDVDLKNNVKEFLGMEIYQGYGCTEGLIISAAGQRDDIEVTTLGIPIHDDIKVEIHDVYGNEVQTGCIGEIAVKGPMLSEGYVNRPDISSQFFKNGYFYTGDLGYIDPQGRINFVGRSLPLTKIAGLMVDLKEIEIVLQSHPDVIEARVVVHGDKDYNLKIAASVIISRKNSISEQDIKMFCSKFLSHYKVPADVKFMVIG